jgi:glycosyltransferase involved in cell wall biosynthesis
MKKISCIIPVYNEGPRIRKVLEVVVQNPLIDEIIVVDDDSVDNTKEIVGAFKGIRLIEHSKNQGKSKAVCTGIQASRNEFIFLLDADLIGLRIEDITSLLKPVIDDKADISISLRRNSPALWKIIGLDYISGERVLPKSILLDNLEKIYSLPKFGIESFMNTVIIKNKYRIKIVSWNTVDSPYKSKKIGFWKGTKAEIQMVFDIFNTIGILGPIVQIVKMLRLKVK